jgi:microcystin-dependent protein
MARVFAVTASTERLRLDSAGRGEVSFTVSNAAGRLLRSRASVKPLGTARAEWFTLLGEGERDLAPGASHQVTVRLAVPASASGTFTFQILVVSIEAPDEDFALGPVTAFEAAGVQAPAARQRPWWLLPVAAALLTTVFAIALATVALWQAREAYEMAARLQERPEVQAPSPVPAASEAPIGSVVAYAGETSTKPDGWLLCDGTSRKVEDFPELYDVIRLKYTANKDAALDKKEFSLPDYRGYFLRGLESLRPGEKPRDPDRHGSDKGVVGSTQDDAIVEHAHTLSARGTVLAASIDRPGEKGVVTDGFDTGGWWRNSGDAQLQVGGPSTPAGRPAVIVGSETRPKNVAVNWLIRSK